MQQAFNVFLCKSRIYPLLKQGLFRNSYTFYGVIWSFIVAVIIVYVPGLNNAVFKAAPIRFVFWLPSLIFGVAIIFYGEIRKLVLIFIPESRFLLW